MKDMNPHIKIIINPIAGARATARKWPVISRLLQRIGLSFDFQYTEGAGHAIEIARAAASDGYRYKTQAQDDADKTARAALGSGRLSKFAKITLVWSQDLPPDQTQGASDWVEADVDVRARCVIPDILGWLGFSFGNKHVHVAERMKQE